ncbi:MAG: tetratricopeptide repeat protein [Proteobacteria bacterium]|nr:tetratricopeptide repeat protein [Pseudomonadota bacterium]
MRPCLQLEDYLVGKLKGQGQTQFQLHLHRCANCRNQMSEWNDLKNRVQDWADHRELPTPSSAEAASLVVSLRPRGLRPIWQRPVIYAGFATAAFLVIISVIFYGERELPMEKETMQASKITDSSKPADVQFPIRVLYSEESELASSSQSFARHLSIPGKGRLLLELGRDRIGLGAQSKIEILQADSKITRIKLLNGSLAAEVEPRLESGTFVVEAKDIVVKVIGTRFGVAMNSDSQIHVTVDEGQVKVVGSGETIHKVEEDQILALEKEGAWRSTSLKAEDRSRLNELLSTDKTVANESIAENGDAHGKKRVRPHKNVQIEPSPEPEAIRDLTTWRKWILDGRYSKAQEALEEYLRNSPGDVQCWSLLANCLRKAGKWEDAIDAYKQVIEQGSSRAANSARFEAAVLLQDKLGRQAAAGALLDEYLRGPLLLEAEAMVRLAKSRLQMGRSAEARELLEQVLERHSSTSAAIQASHLLKKMNASH